MVQRGASGSACERCGAAVPGDAVFCNACGARLRERCPSCQEMNPYGSVYCVQCGTRLSAEPSGPGEPLGWGRGPRRDPSMPNAPSVTCPRCESVSEPGSQYCFSCGLPFDRDTIAGARFSPGIGFAAGLRPVGFWARLFAWIVDSVVVGVLNVIAASVGLALASGGGPGFDPIAFWATAPIGILYYTIGVAVWSTTIGKRTIGAYVLRQDGSRISFLRAAARWLAYIPSALLLYGGFIMIGFRDDKRALHDLICDTVVVYRDR